MISIPTGNYIVNVFSKRQIQMTEKEFFDKSLVLSFEFSRYVVAHPEVEEKIPKGSLVVLVLEDDPEFNERAMELAQAKRESDQPMVVVKIQKLLPPTESRLVNPKLELVSN
jgi:hypothetical protein